MTVADLENFALFIDGMDGTANMILWDETEALPEEFWQSRTRRQRRTPLLRCVRVVTPAHASTVSASGLMWLDSEHIMQALADGHYPLECLSIPSAEGVLLRIGALVSTLGIGAQDPHLISSPRFLRRALRRVAPSFSAQLRGREKELLAAMLEVSGSTPTEVRTSLIHSVRAALCPIIEAHDGVAGSRGEQIDLAVCQLFGGLRLHTRVPRLGHRVSVALLALGPMGIVLAAPGSFATAARRSVATAEEAEADRASCASARPLLRGVQAVLLRWQALLSVKTSLRAVECRFERALASSVLSLDGGHAGGVSTITLRLGSAHAPTIGCMVDAMRHRYVV